MGWIKPEDRMSPDGLMVLIEASGYITNSVIADHSYYLATWIGSPDGGRDPFWSVHTAHEDYPGHIVMFEDDPEWLYKDEAVWEQRTIEDVLADMEKGEQ